MLYSHHTHIMLDMKIYNIYIVSKQIYAIKLYTTFATYIALVRAFLYMCINSYMRIRLFLYMYYTPWRSEHAISCPLAKHITSKPGSYICIIYVYTPSTYPAAAAAPQLYSAFILFYARATLVYNQTLWAITPRRCVYGKKHSRISDIYTKYIQTQHT